MGTDGVLEIEKLYKDKKVILKIRGPLIKDTVQKLNRALEPYCKNMEPVAIDLSEITFIDTFGVANLVEKYRWARIIEQDLSLKGMKQEIKDILQLDGLDHFFNIKDA